MKKLFVHILLCYFTNLSAQSWFRTYTKGAVIYDICNYNNSYFGFGTIGVGSVYSNYLLRVNSNGDTLFTKSFNDVSDSSQALLYHGFVDFNKDLVMVGYAAFTNKLELIKTDTLGNLKWIKTFPINPNGVSVCITPTYDSSYAIFGESSQKGFMLKTDKDGNLLINKNYGYNYNYIKSVVLDADSGFTFCGFDNINFGANFRSFVCKTKPNGDTLWTKYFYDSNKYFFHSISHESSGGYYVGVTDTSTLYILKLSPVGNVVWKSPVNKKGYIYSIDEDIENNVFCSGNNQTSSTDSVYFAKFDPGGYKIFEKSWASGGSEAYKSIQCADSAYVIGGVYADSSLLIKIKPIIHITADYNTSGILCSGNTVCFNDMSTSSNGSIVNWNWFFSDGTSNSPLQNPCHNFASPATYTVILKVTNSSGDIDSTYQSITIDLCTKVDESNLNENIEIYPNPTNSVLKIIDKKNQFKNSIIEIENNIGQVVFTSSFSEKINISHLSTGMYFLTVYDKEISVLTKIIKQ